MGKKRSDLSAPGRPRAKKGKHMPDSEIDFTDMPELSDSSLAKAVRVGRPRSDTPKQMIAFRIDPGLLKNLKKLAKSVTHKVEKVGEKAKRSLSKTNVNKEESSALPNKFDLNREDSFRYEELHRKSS